MWKKLKEAIVDVLDRKLGYYREEDGTFLYEICADYRDEMDAKTAIQILQSPDPLETFWEQLDEWYNDYEWQLRSELEKEGAFSYVSVKSLNSFISFTGG